MPIVTNLIFGSILFLLATGCTSTDQMHTQTVPDANYLAALEWTDPSGYELPDKDSSQETEMLKGVLDLFGTYNEANLSAHTTHVYAEKVYFRDAFKQLDSGEAIRDYLLEGLAPLEGAEFIINKVARSGGDFYLDWLMRLDFKKTPTGTWEESIGMTRLRFNSEGKVIFHQDYWDPTDIVYRRIPIAKQLIAFVKKRL